MRINVGCGRPKDNPSFTKAPWMNLDIRHKSEWSGHPKRYRCLDVRNKWPFPDASVESVYSEHFLEHLTHADTVKVLRNARYALKEGGVFRVCVPDLLRPEPLKRFPHPQTYPHLVLIDFYVMRKLFEYVGFETRPVCHWQGDGKQFIDPELMKKEELGFIARPYSLIVDGIKIP